MTPVSERVLYVIAENFRDAAAAKVVSEFCLEVLNHPARYDAVMRFNGTVKQRLASAGLSHPDNFSRANEVRTVLAREIGILA